MTTENIYKEEKSESVIRRGDSIMNESIKSMQDDIKENRRFISYFFRSLQKKHFSNESLKTECIESLKAYDRDITKLVDEERNTCILYMLF